MNKIKRAWKLVCDFVFYIRADSTIDMAWHLTMITRNRND